MRLLDTIVYGLYANQVTVTAYWPLVFPVISVRFKSFKKNNKLCGLLIKFVENWIVFILNGNIVYIYQNVCPKVPNQTIVVLNVFLKVKLKFYSIKGSTKVRTTQCKNCIYFPIEVFNMNIYSFYETNQNIIIFNC